MPAEVPARWVNDHDTWVPVPRPLRAVLVQDERGWQRAYLIVEPAGSEYLALARGAKWQLVYANAEDTAAK